MVARQKTVPGPPLHQRIRMDIEKKILSGALQPGDRIPAEHELMRDYDCARMTVSKALSRLAESGLIQRRKRAGSFVARPPMHMALMAIPDIQADVIARKQAYEYRILSRELRSASPADLRRLMIEDRSIEVIALTCLHFADGAPFTFEDRIINAHMVPEAVNADFGVEPPGTWLLYRVPWTEAEHQVWAMNAGSTYGNLLEVPEDTACLITERRTWRASTTVTHVRHVFPGNDYHLTAHFSSTPH